MYNIVTYYLAVVISDTVAALLVLIYRLLPMWTMWMIEVYVLNGNIFMIIVHGIKTEHRVNAAYKRKSQHALVAIFLCAQMFIV